MGISLPQDLTLNCRNIIVLSKVLDGVVKQVPSQAKIPGLQPETITVDTTLDFTKTS